MAIFLLASISLRAETNQESNLSEMGEGPLQEVSDIVGTILRLKAAGGSNLELDRSSWQAPEPDKEDAIAMRARMYVQRRVDQATARRLTENMVRAYARPTPLCDDDLQQVAKHTQLESPSVIHSNFANRGIAWIETIPNLKTLTVQTTSITRWWLERFKDKNPNCEIQWK